MSCDHQGTRVIQRLIRHLSDPLHKQMLILALAGDTILALALAEAWRQDHPFTEADFLHPSKARKLQAGSQDSRKGKRRNGHPAADPQRKEQEEKEGSRSQSPAAEATELVDFQGRLLSLVREKSYVPLDDPERMRKQYQN